MRTCLCLSFFVLLLGASGGTAAEVLPQSEPDLLIAAGGALAEVERLCVSLATHESPQIEQLLSLSALQEKVGKKLDEARIIRVDSGIDQVPRLVVQLEGVAVPQCGRYVYRVQTSLNRIVTFTDHGDRQVEAEVWRLRPRMELVAQTDAGEAIDAAVLTQIEVFIAARQAARTLRARPTSAEPNTPGLDTLTPTKPRTQNLGAASQYPFVASKGSAVFHRADCQWVQRIADTNRIGYRTREEAVAAGKRPCKSCKP